MRHMPWCWAWLLDGRAGEQTIPHFTVTRKPGEFSAREDKENLTECG